MGMVRVTCNGKRFSGHLPRTTRSNEPAAMLRHHSSYTIALWTNRETLKTVMQLEKLQADLESAQERIQTLVQEEEQAQQELENIQSVASDFQANIRDIRSEQQSLYESLQLSETETRDLRRMLEGLSRQRNHLAQALEEAERRIFLYREEPGKTGGAFLRKRGAIPNARKAQSPCGHQVSGRNPVRALGRRFPFILSPGNTACPAPEWGISPIAVRT